MAYNYGRRAHSAGFDLPALAGDESAPAVLPLTVAELEALLRLGSDPFHTWAVRGWLQPAQKEA